MVAGAVEVHDYLDLLQQCWAAKSIKNVHMAGLNPELHRKGHSRLNVTYQQSNGALAVLNNRTIAMDHDFWTQWFSGHRAHGESQTGLVRIRGARSLRLRSRRPKWSAECKAQSIYKLFDTGLKFCSICKRRHTSNMRLQTLKTRASVTALKCALNLCRAQTMGVRSYR